MLFSIGSFHVQSYGVSKAVAAIVAIWLLGRAFARLRLPKESATTLVLWATIWGFVGAKAYYVLEHLSDFSLHHLGGMGFTWYGGLIGGVIAALVVIRRHGLPAAEVAGAAAAPLALAYGIGRIGCFLSGDGTYGTPTALPWGVAFPDGVVPSTVPVHPTQLYETVAAVLIAVILWRLERRLAPVGVFGAYLVLSGISRFLVEFLRINTPVLGGLTQPQLWAVVGVVVGGVAIARAGLRVEHRQSRPIAPATLAPTHESGVQPVS
ncbi:prolipoprotein diacylglyceryl transferase [Cellulomonas terrae]|uniref:prolipoprotein diacylglyceryl transferase n=1 Tax=Cellulomonas terrae TaxID=311234 RepID=UPI001FE860D4|nr:prolipoprotein diacylglyceryl transferase [Cellulomonas terrae]